MVQPVKILSLWLNKHASPTHCLFKAQDFRCLFPDLSHSAFKALLSRAVTSNLLIRVCRGLYIFEKSTPSDGLLLYHIAAQLRPNDFNYLSLESALSDAGVISQIPINHITIMSSGRSNKINCVPYGRIEFIHTTQQPSHLTQQLVYDASCGLWRANVQLALRDMKACHRPLDLINWEIANELI